MILKLGVKLMKSAFAAIRGSGLTRNELNELWVSGRSRPASSIKHAKFHVDVGELRKRVVIAIERGGCRTRAIRSSRSDKTCGFMRRILCSLIRQSASAGFGNELGELCIVDRLNFRDDEREQLRRFW